MYRIDFPMDAKEAAVIDRRRRVEEERKQRIFNPRARIIGSDKQALQVQIEEKRQREQQEKELDAAWTREINRQQMLAAEMDRRVEQDRNHAWKEVQEYRRICQRYEDRREFDLNDKKNHKYAARLHDEDHRNGPASMQKFEGEDLSYKQRILNQEQQKKAWLDAQIEERKQNEREYEQADKLYENRLREMSLRQAELSRIEREAKHNVEMAYNQYNLALAREKEERKRLEALADEEASLAHKLNMFHSELLSEVTDATSVNGAFRVGRDRFKGYTVEMLTAIKEEQRRQTMEKMQREKEEKSLEDAYERMAKKYALAAKILDHETECRMKDKKLELIAINKELAEQQRQRQEYMNNMVYKGTVTEGFFEQFNTTTR